MPSQIIGLLIGGVLTAFLFAGSALFAKASMQAGIGLGLYMMLTGVAVAVVGLVIFIFIPDTQISWRSGIYAFGMGALWGIGAACVGLAIGRWAVPLSIIAPLYNMNTLIAVVLALWIFSEWKQVQVPQLLIGAVLIAVGGVLVARA